MAWHWEKGEKKREQSGSLREHRRDDDQPEHQPRSLASLTRLYFPGFLVGKTLCNGFRFRWRLGSPRPQGGFL